MVSTPRYAEQRDRARAFARRWQGETHERAESQTFWNEMLDVFGVNRKQVARFEPLAKRYSTGRHGFIDMLWPGRLLAEQKSGGEDLEKALEQALDYLPGMEEADIPSVVVVCDFEHFILRDLETGQTHRFLLNNLPVKLELFGILDGRDRRDYSSDEDVNLRATEHIAAFGEALEAGGYPEHMRRVLLTRILFCLFSDDAGVWPLGAFEDFLRLRTRPDGSDLGAQLAWLFQVLDTGDERRGTLPEDMRDFTYVNGSIFSERLDISLTDKTMRDSLLEASRFNWSRISPAIFGSMFQNVMTKSQRRNLGAHYTSEGNILKLIRPLFLDGLESDLARAKTASQLRAFRDKLATLKFLDPACGCGNFLIVTYRHLRRLETECLLRLRAAEAKAKRLGVGQQTIDVSLESKISVAQFYGIEIDEWPCRIAEVAMHIAAHLADVDLMHALGGGYYAHFPIQDTANISNDNALTTDWETVLPAAECTYVMGNPPFVGRVQRTATQTIQLRRVWGYAYNGYLDFVTGWLAKASSYLATSRSDWAFVVTASACQGEPVTHLWKPLLDAGWRLRAAHRDFAWSTDAGRPAAVHVSILIFTAQPGPATLTTYEDGPEGRSLQVANINPYLCPGPDLLVKTLRRALSPELPHLELGSQPSDGGNLIVTEDQYATVAADPVAARYLRPYVGADELVHAKQRWCLWLVDAPSSDIRSSPILRERVAKVAELGGSRRALRNAQPHLFSDVRQPTQDYLCLPCHASVNWRWFPVAHLQANVIASNAVYRLIDPDGHALGILSSAMFMTWSRAVSGRLGPAIRFAHGLAYNNFPLPALTDDMRQSLTGHGRAVESNRNDEPLSEQYDPLAMRKPLADAHRALDRYVDSLFGLRRQPDNAARLERLFTVATEMQGADKLM